MNEIVKVEGYELTPSKSEIKCMVADMMKKIDVVLGIADSENTPDIDAIQIPEGMSVYTVANIAAQAAMMEEFASQFKKEMAKRMPTVMKQFEGDPSVNRSGSTMNYHGVTFTIRQGIKVYDYSSSAKWAKQSEKVAALKSKLKDAEADLEATEKKLRNSGEAYVTDQKPSTLSMSLGK